MTNTKTAPAPLDAINALVGRNLAANYGKGPFVLDAGELDRLTYLFKAVRDEQNRLETAVAEAHRLLNTVPLLMQARANARWEKEVVAWLNRNAPAPAEKEEP